VLRQLFPDQSKASRRVGGRDLQAVRATNGRQNTVIGNMVAI